VLTLALLALLPACRDGSSASASSDAGPLDLEPLPPERPGLTLRLTPHPDRDVVDVEVHVSGEHAAQIQELAVARSWAGVDAMTRVRDLRVRDVRGEIPTVSGPESGPDRVLTLTRAPEGGHLAVRYATASAPPSAARFALHTDRERFSGVGHAFLLLPRLAAAKTEKEAKIPAHIQIRPGALAPGSSGASSFGPGDDVETTVSPAELAHAVYLAGRIRVLDRAPDARLVVSGRPAFDSASALRSISRADSALRAVFGEPPEPVAPAGPDIFSFVLVAEPGLGKSHDGALLARSFALWLADDRPFDAPLAIAAAHELGHRWLGTAVRLEDERGEEALWFSEGFTVHYARKALFAEGLLSATEFAEDLERTLARGGESAPGHVRSRREYQRGALYAASLDAAIQKESDGSRSLDDLVRELIRKASAEQKPAQPTAALRELVVRELGAARGEEFDWVMVKGHGEIRVDEDAFGPCFFRARTRRKVYDLGFDPGSLRGQPAIVRNLAPGSAAARAGLREGAIILSSKVPPPPAEGDGAKPAPVELTIVVRKKSRLVKYVPLREREEIRWATAPGCRR
jgi:predicted metalloprotease with PDZ domain